MFRFQITQGLLVLFTMISAKAQRFVDAIKDSGLTMYEPIEIGDPVLWIPAAELEILLDEGLRGLSFAGLPLRTRSKAIKECVCKLLGYPNPGTFTKTQPRFPGQQLDCYSQKSNNLQIWNEELAATRRYALIQLSATDEVTKVKVVTGDTLALLDTTGTLTQKYQARLITGPPRAELLTPLDTDILQPMVSLMAGERLRQKSPTDYPEEGALLPIADVYAKLMSLLDSSFSYYGEVQERTRGAELHRLVCDCLGYIKYHDDGRFPDVRHQLVEVKLQTSPTIDLGLVRPDSDEALDIPMIEGKQIRHRDIRYVMFYGVRTGSSVTLRNLYVTTGQYFFTRFPQFQGKILNKKLQIPLPSDFFDR